MIITGVFPSIVIGDSGGWIHIWSIRPAPLKNTFLYKFKNSSTNSTTGVPVHSMEFYPHSCFLITGDENGEIKIWNLRNLFEKHNIKAHLSKNKSALIHSPFNLPNAEISNLHLSDLPFSNSDDNKHDNKIENNKIENEEKNSLSTNLINGFDPSVLVPLIKQWKGHSDFITWYFVNFNMNNFIVSIL